jgi:hypothetical protein
MKPDLVHIQNEHGLYGLKLSPVNLRMTSTNIDSQNRLEKISWQTVANQHALIYARTISKKKS